MVAPRKGIQDSLGLDSTPWIPDSRYWIPDSLSLELGYRVPIVSGIPDSVSCISDSKTQDFKFHQQKFPRFQNPDSLLSWGGLWSRKTDTA